MTKDGERVNAEIGGTAILHIYHLNNSCMAFKAMVLYYLIGINRKPHICAR